MQERKYNQKVDKSIRREIFTSSIYRTRFIQIRTFLPFDDKIIKAERIVSDKLAAIRKLWGNFIDIFKKSCIPHDTIKIFNIFVNSKYS